MMVQTIKIKKMRIRESKMRTTKNQKTMRDMKYKMTYKIRQVMMQKLTRNDKEI